METLRLTVYGYVPTDALKMRQGVHVLSSFTSYHEYLVVEAVDDSLDDNKVMESIKRTYEGTGMIHVHVTKTGHQIPPAVSAK